MNDVWPQKDVRTRDDIDFSMFAFVVVDTGYENIVLIFVSIGTRHNTAIGSDTRRQHHQVSTL